MIFPWVYWHNNPQLIDQPERAHWFGYYIKTTMGWWTDLFRENRQCLWCAFLVTLVDRKRILSMPVISYMYKIVSLTCTFQRYQTQHSGNGLPFRQSWRRLQKQHRRSSKVMYAVDPGMNPLFKETKMQKNGKDCEYYGRNVGKPGLNPFTPKGSPFDQ